ncbi:MAG: hypothetical protein ACR2RV_02870 [Verrucomicrobiales bacterium]
MPLFATTILILAAFAQATTAPPAEEASSGNSVQLSNADFRIPPNSRWRDERIMSAPKLALLVDLGTEKNVRGTMSILSRQLLDIDVASESELRLKFIQADTTTDIDFGKDRNRQTTPLPLDGKTILAERGDRGRWSSKLDRGRRPTGEESAALYALSYLWADGLYPDRRVTIGESWTVEAKQLRNLFGSDLKKPVGEFVFTLARIVEYEGEECAKITGKGKLRSQTKSLGSGATGTEDVPLEATMDLSIEIYRSLELAMDLSVKMTGTLELNNAQDEEAFSYKAISPVEFSRKLGKR